MDLVGLVGIHLLNQYHIKHTKGAIMRKQYIAIGISQHKDTRDQVRAFYVDTNGIDARNYIINHFDQSLIWTYTESNNYIK